MSTSSEIEGVTLLPVSDPGRLGAVDEPGVVEEPGVETSLLLPVDGEVESDPGVDGVDGLVEAVPVFFEVDVVSFPLVEVEGFVDVLSGALGFEFWFCEIGASDNLLDGMELGLSQPTMDNAIKDNNSKFFFFMYLCLLVMQKR